MSDKWYFSRAGTEGQGPVTLQDLQTKCTFGDLSATDLVWCQGMPQWVAAAAIPELVFPPPEFPPQSASPAAAVQAIPLETVSYSQPHPHDSITCTPRTIHLLRQTRPWARIMAIMIFIAAGLMILGGVAMMFASTFGARDTAPAIVGIVYFVIAALYIAPAVYLNRYCSRITQLIALRRDDLLEQAIEAQKSFWKFCGIFTLIAIGVYVLFAIIMVVVFAFH